MIENPREISNIEDVDYLLTRLAVAKKNGESEVKKEIINRIKQLGLLDLRPNGDEDPSRNLRSRIIGILGGDDECLRSDEIPTALADAEG